MIDHRGADNQPAWSPDGRQIAFVSDRTGEGDLYLVASTGGDPVRLTRGAPVSRPSWSPDGGRIAFSQEGDIRSVDPLTGVISVLSDAPEWEGYPAWSPGGDRIALSADGELAILDLRQGAARRITRGYSHAAYPSWSPDQACIAFSSYRERAPDIYLFEIDSERIARITHARDTWGHREPVWNPRTSAVFPPPVTVPPRHGSRTKVEARILGEGAAGLILELTRAIAGRQPDYAWSAVTDSNGYGELTISGDRRVSGFYQARARNRAGEVVGRWTSIPLNEGRPQLVELTLGGGVRVAAIQPLGPATAEAPPERTGLIAHYPFDGDARDASGNGYHGTMEGPVPTQDRFGKEDGAVLFHGSDHRIDLPHQALDGLFDVTVSFWLKTTKSGAQAILSGANLSNDNEHILFFISESRFRFYSHGRVGQGQLWCDVDVRPINDGAWHHFAVVRNASEGNADFFIDGAGYLDQWGYLERAGCHSSFAGRQRPGARLSQPLQQLHADPLPPGRPRPGAAGDLQRPRPADAHPGGRGSARRLPPGRLRRPRPAWGAGGLGGLPGAPAVPRRSADAKAPLPGVKPEAASRDGGEPQRRRRRASRGSWSLGAPENSQLRWTTSNRGPRSCRARLTSM
ncbi:MAG: LpqB family beta-propeller domain-containing protein [Gemmatimonadetes bacterium]|nr:LpqB family beta-propeller domain-containing protein [Gemmatimonadota bacterium]